jgi:putative ABC transport system permease protein
MSRLLWRASRRHLLRHPWQIGLSVLGIALGVAVAVSIHLANDSARRAFDLATEAVTGRATHQIIGGPSGLAEAVYGDLRVRLGVRRAAPIVEGDAGAADFPGRTFHLFGIDPFAEEPFRPHLTARHRTGGGRAPLDALADLVARPGTALMSSATAAALGLKSGDTLALRLRGGRHEVRLVGLLEPADALSARALDSLLVTDIATAQELLGARGRLSRIDLIVPDDASGAALLERIGRALPAGAELTQAGARADAAAQMTRAFALNLTALSLLALVVGMFLIYNTMTFSVVQRRPLIGMLRALGVTRGEIFTLVMVEALAIGVIGTAAGLVLGLAMAQGLLRLVTRTINDLYFVLSVREVILTPLAIAMSVVLGVGATLAAALAPALEATGARPREVLTRSRLDARTRRAVPVAAWCGAALLTAGGALLLFPGAGVGLGFAALFLVLIGCALVTPAAAIGLLRILGPMASHVFGLLGRVAARGIVASLSRTAVAIAALMIAVSTAVGVGIMIASFREAVVQWLEGTLRADVYVSPPSLVGSRPDAALDPEVIRRLSHAPGVASASTSRGAVVPSPRGPVQLVALGLETGRVPGFRLRQGRPETVWPAFERGEVIVSEPYANRHRARVGSVVRLRTDQGERDFRVAGIFYDYGSSAGVVIMHRTTYDRWWTDRAVSSLGLYAAPGTDTTSLVETLRRASAGGPDVVIRSNRDLRDASLEIFDRTFAITAVLRILTGVVAFIGVLSALMALQLERMREIGVLRALGLTPRQVWGMVTAETGLMGLIAGLLAMPVGILLATVLVYAINRRSFGWTMPVDVQPAMLLQGLALAVGAALLAGLYPALRMARAQAAEALRDE